MNKIKLLPALLLALVLAACGGGSDGCSGGSISGSCTTNTPNPGDPSLGNPSSIQVLTSSTDLFTDVTRNNVVDILAIVRDENGAVLPNIVVVFSASNNGSITVLNAITDNSGIAQAELNNGTDLSNRDVVVTATVSGAGISGTSPTITVRGTNITLSGGTSTLTLNESTSYNVVLKDSLGQGIPNTALDISVGAANNVSSGAQSGQVITIQTKAAGDATFNVQGLVLGADAVTVAALGEIASSAFTVTNDVFQFTSPAPMTEVPIGTTQPLTLRWEESGAVVGQSVSFSTTRGSLTGGDDCGNPVGCDQDLTDANGDAVISISSTDAGMATIVAQDASDPTLTNSITIEFVAVNAATLELKTQKTRVDVGESTNIIAQVRDASGNAVKNKQVRFTLQQDVTLGEVFPATAITDSNGEARTVYTGGDTPSASDGVVIRANVVENPPLNPAVEDTVNLTVAGVARDVTIGTGNTIFEIGTATYGKEYIVIVKDGVGNAKPNALVEVSLLSRRFYKGTLQADVINGVWFREDPPAAVCDNEDQNTDGILDVGEDTNNNGRLEPGNVAVVAAVNPAAPEGSPCSLAGFGTGSQAADVITNANGLARVCIYYPQSYAQWVEAEIEARTQVSGTEFGNSSVFDLPVAADDVDDLAEAPPNLISPFGVTANCAEDF